MVKLFELPMGARVQSRIGLENCFVCVLLLFFFLFFPAIGWEAYSYLSLLLKAWRNLKQSNIIWESSLCLLKGKKNINPRWHFNVFQSEGRCQEPLQLFIWFIDVVSIQEAAGKYFRKWMPQNGLRGRIRDLSLRDLRAYKMFLEKIYEFSRVARFNILIF